MVEKFKVGKKYKSNRLPGVAPLEVMYVGDYLAFYRTLAGREGSIHCGDSILYDEYYEPKIEKFVKNVLRYRNEPPITGSNMEDYSQLGKIEITLKDGKLSSVNIVEGE